MISPALAVLSLLALGGPSTARMERAPPVLRSHLPAFAADKRGALAAMSGSPNCGSDPGWKLYNSTINVTTHVGDHERTYLVHVPEDYDKDTQHPVVLSFHGYGKTAEHQEVASQLSEPGNKINGIPIIAAYPQGLVGVGRSGDGSDGKYSWQASEYSSPNASDIQFTHTILNELMANLCVDRTRVYATGNSNGGGFTNRLACTRDTSARIAAFGIASGALYPDSDRGDDCHPSRKIPLLITHGANDTVVPYKGGHPHNDNWSSPDIDKFAKGWAARNGFDADGYNATEVDAYNATLWTWGEDGDAGQVKRFKVRGMRHQWPSTVEGLDKQNKSAPFNLTGQELMPFFERYSLDI
ncbi:carbohydrate esterase family 1 protein [Schizophyllum commune Tattone D]|nr:carbohydrate esterase family 1 protein [Schizophyllum commune Loenen D]KAI5834167.1 carbohydrate esterase family 1 protein [Schizophyllum commune Tattone D]